MNKLVGGLAAGLVVLALALGAGGGLAVGMARAWQAPAVIAEIARQEGARADVLRADAAAAWGRADAESLRAAAAAEESAAAAAARADMWAELARQWPVIIGGLLAAGAVALAAAVAAWARWVWSRAGLQTMAGGLAVISAGGRAVLVDRARMVGGLVELGADGVLPVLQVSEELSADIARADIVGRAVAAVASGARDDRAALAAKVTGELGAAFANLAGAVGPGAPVAATLASGVPPAPSMRLIKVVTPEQKARAENASEAAELKEFVEVGAAGRGFGRRQWASEQFKSTGRACSQTRWAVLSGALRDAGLVDAGRLVCPVAEALERLGFEVAKSPVEADSDKESGA